MSRGFARGLCPRFLAVRKIADGASEGSPTIGASRSWGVGPNRHAPCLPIPNRMMSAFTSARAATMGRSHAPLRSHRR